MQSSTLKPSSIPIYRQQIEAKRKVPCMINKCWHKVNIFRSVTDPYTLLDPTVKKIILREDTGVQSKKLSISLMKGTNRIMSSTF